jgi:hypothetical protein
MSLFVYLPTVSEKGNRLLESLRGLPAGVSVEAFEIRAGFIRRLRQPKDDSSIAILFDPSRADLEELDRASQFFANVPLLLVLADQDAATMALALRLLPTFITYIDSDLSQILSVVSRLLPSPMEARKS